MYCTVMTAQNQVFQTFKIYKNMNTIRSLKAFVEPKICHVSFVVCLDILNFSWWKNNDSMGLPTKFFFFKFYFFVCFSNSVGFYLK